MRGATTHLRRFAVVVACGAALLSGCGGSDPSVAGDWKLDVVEGKTLVAQPVTLKVDGDAVSAHLGCNELTGKAKVSGGRLSVEPSGLTEKGCEPFEQVAEQERWLQKFLEGGAAVSAPDKDRLVLTSDGVTLTFRRAG